MQVLISDKACLALRPIRCGFTFVITLYCAWSRSRCTLGPLFRGVAAPAVSRSHVRVCKKFADGNHVDAHGFVETNY